MPIQNEDGLYAALAQALKAHKKPMDCHELYDLPNVRKHAQSANRVSDYLGNMWRKGQLTRTPSGGESRARWVYQWRVGNPETSAPARGAQVLVARPKLNITETADTITISLPDFDITITRK